MTSPVTFYIMKKDTKLPFNIIKGSEKERFQKAYDLNKKIFQEINQKMVDDKISISDFSEAINNNLSPYNIKYSVKEKEENLGSTAAYLGRIIKSYIPFKDIEFIYLDRFEFAFDIKENKITTDKHVIFHEVGHLLDNLFSPKSIKRIIKTASYPDKTYQPLAEICDKANNYKGELLGIISLFELAEDILNIKYLANKLPDREAIDALQRARMHIKTEINQYQNTLKIRMHDPLKNFTGIVIDSLFLSEAYLHTRFNVLSKLLKSRITKVRTEHKANLMKISQSRQ